ncbi:DUF6174 domain-containing protein [Nocardioides zhouii]|uniref:Uncharacterized protein n=1 Tax=Nocardioides zhouii TaxID=1168729 RepID=A0A4Q2T3P9_9ACTN|nr:DUF6174 domain-containing protein [Nocardioides zhouii]RYC12651.1 hypothetical protein EUA94_08285 [Nocardioides zhouii]
MTTMKHVLTAALVPLALVVSGWSAGATPAVAADPQPVQPFVPGINEDPELSTAWQEWQSKEIEDYVISVRVSCFCVPAKPVVTIIRGDRMIKVTQGDRRLRPRRGSSMDELFSMIREATAASDSVTVDYARRGVPKSIAIDPSTMVADDETYYTVSVVRSD